MPISAYLRGLREKVGTDLLMVPGVVAVIRDDEGRVLLARRSDDGYWNLPSGAVDPGEEPARALTREVWEETGLKVRPERLLGVVGGPGFRHTYPNGDCLESTAIAFECRVLEGRLQVRDGESTELGYFPLDALPQPMHSHAARLLVQALGQQEPFFQWDPSWLEELAPE